MADPRHDPTAVEAFFQRLEVWVAMVGGSLIALAGIAKKAIKIARRVKRAAEESERPPPMPPDSPAPGLPEPTPTRVHRYDSPSSDLMDALVAMGAQLRERERAFDALELRLRESERVQRDVRRLLAEEQEKNRALEARIEELQARCEAKA